MRALALLAFLAASSPAVVYAQGAGVNALWNDSGPKDHLGFWLYPLKGGCPDLRAKAKPLVFATKNHRTEHAVSELWYCFQLPEQAQAPLTNCKAGSVRIAHEAKSNRYSGTYSFVMADGSKREGSFEAEFCPKENR